jgi:hypothetical protein
LDDSSYFGDHIYDFGELVDQEFATWHLPGLSEVVVANLYPLAPVKLDRPWTKPNYVDFELDSPAPVVRISRRAICAWVQGTLGDTPAQRLVLRDIIFDRELCPSDGISQCFDEIIFEVNPRRLPRAMVPFVMTADEEILQVYCISEMHG